LSGEHAEQSPLSIGGSRVASDVEELAMDLIYKTVAGLDVHQKTIVVCVRAIQPQGGVVEQVKTFGTMTSDLLQMSDWLAEQGVTHVAMESTGVLWKPVWNILEGAFELLLVNPVELKRVPGRKSDVRDCQWIAHLLQCGLLRSSFVAPRAQRDLRDLTRYRAQLTAELTRIVNRVHKTLEDANIKLGAVASDIMGKSGRAMLCALLQGERDPRKLAELAQGQLRGKIPELTRALEGRVTEHHCFLLRNLLDHIAYVESQIELFSTRIADCLRPILDDGTMERLDEIPGVNRRTVENVIAEIGRDMGQFPDEDHISSWAGMSPGNEESAGKRIRKRTTKGNRWLRRALVEAAWAASHTKRSYLGAQYRRLAARRGKKRALIAVGHTLLVIFYHLLKKEVHYIDLGPDYFDKLKPEQFRRYLVKRLESLGYDVALSPKDPAA
jgi:transposase